MNLVCGNCGQTQLDNTRRWVCGCGGLFDLDFAPSLDRDAVASRPPDMWRYQEALPASPASFTRLGEGMTPMVTLPVAGRNVLVKTDQSFPTGSYKDRGAALMISKAKEIGVTEVVEDSSGNAGAAVAAYCARAGIGCRIFVPESTSPGKLAQIQLYGARLERIAGSREQTAQAAVEAAGSAYYASHCYNPYFFHGTKTWAYEVAEQLGWSAPDAVVLPAGNGTLLLGAHLGFKELVRMGVLGSVPKLIAVQAQACAPLHQAYQAGSDQPAEAETSPTLAEGIAIAAPARGAQMLAAVRETGGSFISVGEDEISAALLEVGRQGFCIEPTSAAAIAGLARYLETSPPSERVVSVFTGHGLKAASTIQKLLALQA
ncbi:MAG: threonine synthase [Desulfovibrionales bacterium]|nr:threonine synthase [Desulfovibrionales bacterium]